MRFSLNNVWRQFGLLLGMALFCHSVGFADSATSFRSKGRVAGPTSMSLQFQYGLLQAPNLGVLGGSEYVNEKRSHSGRIAFEWVPIRSIGDLSIGSALGFFAARTSGGNVIYGAPVEASLGYRARFWQNQILVPMARVGTAFAPLFQKSGGTRTALTWDYTVGLHILLNFLDPKASHSLFRNTGISKTYLTLEYTEVKTLNSKAAPDDTSGNILRAGIRVDF